MKNQYEIDYQQGYDNANDEWLERMEKIRAEIKEWYWQVDKQALAKDPCVVDAVVDLFIRTIDKYAKKEEKQLCIKCVHFNQCLEEYALRHIYVEADKDGKCPKYEEGVEK